ncbi:hypothetical protein [Aquibacillus sediminis]|uniref:hypothetical protein n=1 Tax=Aquibacillus sediminis TaxID=2574734 RepID=UPI0011093332|nr:hypothetical protein [Aquibacillus sediminis]
MSVEHMYHRCCRYKNRPVAIRTHDGKVHRGIIRNVNRNRVFLDPLDRRRDLGGFGYPYWGWGPGYGFGYGLALGAIAGITLLPFFFW